jgi:hypothetical protein
MACQVALSRRTENDVMNKIKSVSSGAVGGNRSHGCCARLVQSAILCVPSICCNPSRDTKSAHSEQQVRPQFSKPSRASLSPCCHPGLSLGVPAGHGVRIIFNASNIKFPTSLVNSHRYNYSRPSIFL